MLGNQYILLRQIFQKTAKIYREKHFGPQTSMTVAELILHPYFLTSVRKLLWREQREGDLLIRLYSGIQT